MASEFDMFIQLIARCEWVVELTVSRRDSDVGTRISFTFADGMLRTAQGRWMYVTGQDIP